VIGQTWENKEKGSYNYFKDLVGQA